MEYDTFVRHRLPISSIIGNDACWSQIARDQMPWFNSLVGCELAVFLENNNFKILPFSIHTMRKLVRVLVLTEQLLSRLNVSKK